jgi:hypothetical protein
MKELTKVFKDIEIKVDVLDDRNMMFDISGVASKFGKKFHDYERTDMFKRYLKKRVETDNLKETEMIKRIGHQVKIHNKLFVHFARWVNEDFEIVADNMIYDILTGKNETIEKQLSFKDNKIMEQQKQIIKLQESTYAKRRGVGFETVFRIISDHGIDISASELNKILVDEGVITKDKCFACNRFDLRDNGTTSMISDGSIVVHVDTVLAILRKHGVKTIEDTQMVMEF